MKQRVRGCMRVEAHGVEVLVSRVDQCAGEEVDERRRGAGGAAEVGLCLERRKVLEKEEVSFFFFFFSIEEAIDLFLSSLLFSSLLFSLLFFLSTDLDGLVERGPGSLKLLLVLMPLKLIRHEGREGLHRLVLLIDFRRERERERAVPSTSSKNDFLFFFSLFSLILENSSQGRTHSGRARSSARLSAGPSFRKTPQISLSLDIRDRVQLSISIFGLQKRVFTALSPRLPLSPPPL